MDTDLRDERCRVVGTKQLLKKLAVDEIAQLYLAKDAQQRIKDELLEAAKKSGVPVTEIDTMAHLGQMCGIAVGSAAAGLLKEAQ